VYNNFTEEICKRLREFGEIHERLHEFEEIEISAQSCRGDCEKQGRKLGRLLSGFRPRIRPQVCTPTFQTNMNFHRDPD
jgi:hypothetical protein